MAGAKNHDYHILPPSIMPLMGSISALVMTSGGVLFMHDNPLGKYILLLGFAHGNAVLTALGGMALLVYAGGYYYELDVTLLVKSQVLAATGAVLLALRWVLLRWLGADSGETGHD